MKKVLLLLGILIGLASAGRAQTSALSVLSAPASGDLVKVVDVSDTSTSANGTDKKLTLGALGTFLGGTNGLTITSSTGTLTIANTKTLTASNTITLAGTDGATLNVGAGGTLGTAAFTAASAYATAGHTHAFTDLTGRPTTLSGYGITDAAASGGISSSGLTMSTSRLLGRWAASSGAVQEVTIGSGLSLSGAGVLSATSTFDPASPGAIGGTTAAAGSFTTLSLAGHQTFGTDNTYDVGASGATRPRTVYAATSVHSPAIVFNTATNTGRAMGTNSSGIDVYVQFGGSVGFGAGLQNSNDTQLYWTNGGSWTATRDTGLVRSAAAVVKVTNASTGYGFLEDEFRRKGSGSPEGAVSAPVGAVYHRTDGGAGTSLYVKESGSGNTGWVAK